ncbi:unnamed protein product [Cylicocyclus nassatus]|uniref:C2H2-type domain-containing protein n=1 Tax=Cylicocyclus nassatus TaxID=53992 RepID=A0AA36MGR7_CYLNA|nr:unnamed protein product [Cylicocyclus nassatus]
MINCPGCAAKFQSNLDYARHCEAHHKSEDPLVVVSNTFESFGLFEAHLNGLGTVHVTACFGHYGHAISMAALPLFNEDEDVVKNLIEAGVPARTIVSKLRRENWNPRQDPERQMRLCYLTTTNISDFLMTDDTLTFYNAFKSVFPESRAQKVPCAFHVSQAFLRKHKELLSSPDVSIAQHMFNALLGEVNPRKFEENFNAYISWLTSVEAVEMATYIERNYSQRRHEWAVCCRPNAPFKTTNHAESWHNKLKHILLRSKQNNRLDVFVYTLIEYSQDHNLQLISAGVRGSDLSGRRKRNTRRHKDALSYYTHATLKNQFGELAKAYAKSNRLDLINQMNEFMKNGLGEMPQEALENRFVRKAVMQTTGAGLAPSRIQPQYKSRTQLRLEKKEKHHPYNYIDEDFE